MRHDGGVRRGFTSIAVTNGASSFGGSFNYSTGVLTLTAVPEPGTWVGMVLMLGTCGWYARRNRTTRTARA